MRKGLLVIMVALLCASMAGLYVQAENAPNMVSVPMATDFGGTGSDISAPGVSIDNSSGTVNFDYSTVGEAGGGRPPLVYAKDAGVSPIHNIAGNVYKFTVKPTEFSGNNSNSASLNIGIRLERGNMYLDHPYEGIFVAWQYHPQYGNLIAASVKEGDNKADWQNILLLQPASSALALFQANVTSNVTIEVDDSAFKIKVTVDNGSSNASHTFDFAAKMAEKNLTSWNSEGGFNIIAGGMKAVFSDIEAESLESLDFPTAIDAPEFNPDTMAVLPLKYSADSTDIIKSENKYFTDYTTVGNETYKVSMLYASTQQIFAEEGVIAQKGEVFNDIRVLFHQFKFKATELNPEGGAQLAMGTRLSKGNMYLWHNHEIGIFLVFSQDKMSVKIVYSDYVYEKSVNTSRLYAGFDVFDGEEHTIRFYINETSGLFNIAVDDYAVTFPLTLELMSNINIYNYERGGFNISTYNVKSEISDIKLCVYSENGSGNATEDPEDGTYLSYDVIMGYNIEGGTTVDTETQTVTFDKEGQGENPLMPSFICQGYTNSTTKATPVNTYTADFYRFNIIVSDTMAGSLNDYGTIYIGVRLEDGASAPWWDNKYGIYVLFTENNMNVTVQDGLAETQAFSKVFSYINNPNLNIYDKAEHTVRVRIDDIEKIVYVIVDDTMVTVELADENGELPDNIWLDTMGGFSISARNADAVVTDITFGDTRQQPNDPNPTPTPTPSPTVNTTPTQPSDGEKPGCDESCNGSMGTSVIFAGILAAITKFTLKRKKV